MGQDGRIYRLSGRIPEPKRRVKSAIYIAKFKDLVSPKLKKLSRVGQRTFNNMDKSQNRFFSRLKARAKEIDNTRGKVMSLGAAFRTAFLGFSLIQLGRDIFNVNARFETMQKVLENSLGSQSVAQSAFKALQNFGKKVPFTVNEITGSYVKLVGRGLKPTENKLRQMSDLASSVLCESSRRFIISNSYNLAFSCFIAVALFLC